MIKTKLGAEDIWVDPNAIEVMRLVKLENGYAVKCYCVSVSFDITAPDLESAETFIERILKSRRS